MSACYLSSHSHSSALDTQHTISTAMGTVEGAVVTALWLPVKQAGASPQQLFHIFRMNTDVCVTVFKCGVWSEKPLTSRLHHHHLCVYRGGWPNF